MSVLEWVKSTRVFRSIYRNPYPSTTKSRLAVMVDSLVLHLHPARIVRRGTWVTYTWGLGGLSAWMFVILTVTGVFLMWYYIPNVQDAYWSIRAIESEVVFGQFMRNLHRWAAHAMVILVFLHMCRVFYTGAYKPPREFNWVIGVALLTLTFLMSFTGYLLPWDQLAYWAITVGTNIGGATPFIGDQINFLLLGGYEIGQATLIRWYTLHVIFLPLAVIGLMSLHFWRVRKDGGISTPVLEDEAEGPGVPPAMEEG